MKLYRKKISDVEKKNSEPPLGLSKICVIRKWSITLIELLIVMAVLAMALGVIGFNTYKAIREQQFKTESELVVDYLRLAQNLMLIMNADASINFQTAADKKSIEMSIEIEGHVNKKYLSLISDKQKNLKQIHYVQFIDENQLMREKDKIKVRFLSKGSVLSKGVMRIATHKTSDEAGVLEKFICLPGFAKPLYSVNKKDEDPACDTKKESQFDESLIQYTIQEIHAKQTTTPHSTP